MGCDIHGWLQKRHRGDKHWEPMCAVPDHRNYMLFAALANVRNYNEIRPFSEPRGLPKDAFIPYGSKDEAINDFGEHSFSYFSLKELIEWDGWDQEITYRTMTGWQGEITTKTAQLREMCAHFMLWLDYLKEECRWFNDDNPFVEYRLVIGFDS